MAATYDDLKDVLVTSLESRGILADLRARLRAEVFKSLHEDNPSKPDPVETQILNELVMEYLEYNGYQSTMSVFSSEARIKKGNVRPREEIVQDLAVDDTDYPPEIPLLYGLALKHRIQSSQHNDGRDGNNRIQVALPNALGGGSQGSVRGQQQGQGGGDISMGTGIPLTVDEAATMFKHPNSGLATTLTSKKGGTLKLQSRGGMAGRGVQYNLHDVRDFDGDDDNDNNNDDENDGLKAETIGLIRLKRNTQDPSRHNDFSLTTK
ncbi:hypothetical protein HDV05_007036 [Chytridiales sp. JEL 0842]|nr:hypothetical protein HDV05_007036 [Chytridiales sp. JEL 0842]